MNTEPKILLTIKLEGGALHRSGIKEKREFILRKKDLTTNKLDKKDGDRIVKKGKYYIEKLVPSEASLVTKLCGEAYDYITSMSCPEWYKNPKEWKKMKRGDRLELHLARICNSYNGKSFSYNIIED